MWRHNLPASVPVDVACASIISYVGETPNDDAKAWRFETSTTKIVVDLEFPNNLATGTNVWIAAFLFNSKSEASPLSRPASALIGYCLSAAG